MKKKKVIVKKKSKKQSKPNYKNEIRVDQILLHNRQVFLSGVIDTEKAHDIVTKLTALNAYDTGAPIVLWINSPGGSVYDGFAIIDCMTTMKSPVITIVSGKACSMGGIISIFGMKRYMTKNSVWMAHDMSTGNFDYITKTEDRFENSKRLQSKVIQMFREKTKLTEKDLEKSRHGELWLEPKECKAKKIVDDIIG